MRDRVGGTALPPASILTTRQIPNVSHRTTYQLAATGAISPRISREGSDPRWGDLYENLLVGRVPKVTTGIQVVGRDVVCRSTRVSQR